MANYVWNDRNWLYDPTGTKPGPHYDYGWDMQRNTIPYYGQDISSLLAQMGFPGAVAGQTFGSMFLEPQRQKNIVEQLNMLTQSGGKTRADNYQKSLNQNAMDTAKQTAASLYGSAGGGSQFKASNLLAQINRARQEGAKYRSEVSDPMNIARQRQQTIMGGFQSPMLNNVAQFIPGLEQQRQNNSFFGNLLNTGLQLWGAGAFNGPKGGGASKGHPWFGVGGSGW